jgi:ubiquinone/menaquinone biosynthesis C-methylase UbiE
VAEEPELASDANVTFTSHAYDGSLDEYQRAKTTAWLEEQAQHPFIRETGRRTLERLALDEGEAVLDVGCGTGVFLASLLVGVGSGGRVVGLDHNAALLEQAATRMADAGLADAPLELVHGDALALPFEGGSFDATHCERVLMHLAEPDAAIAEMRRVTRPGGRVVAAEINAWSASIYHPDPEAAQAIANAMIAGIRQPQMGISLRRRFLEAGLEDVGGEVVADFETVLDEEEAVEMERSAKVLVASGSLDAERAEVAIRAMRDAMERDVHCGVAQMFIVSGRVPETHDA